MVGGVIRSAGIKSDADFIKNWSETASTLKLKSADAYGAGSVGKSTCNLKDAEPMEKVRNVLLINWKRAVILL